METSFAISVQALGTLMVAALLWQLTRLISGRFLRYWSFAWICLTFSLFALRMTYKDYVAESLRPAGFTCYMLGEYCFGFFLWTGFRDYAFDAPFTRRDLRVFVLLVPFALAAPWTFREEILLPLHTVLMAAFFAAAFFTVLQIHSKTQRIPVGLNIVRVMLGGLALIFFCYGPMLVWSQLVDKPIEWQYLRLLPIYDALIELGLAFGMVVLAFDRAQDLLEAKNRELAETSRRDALTGLFNRRAFDETIAELSGSKSGGSLAVIDVNDLKLINDRHLHAAGDGVLMLVARALVARFRVTDPIFRIGGDEFAVVMPGGTDTDLASRMADIDDSLMNLRVPGIAEPTDLRIAWGVVAYASGSDLTEAFNAADRAMYACKSRRKHPQVTNS